MFMQIIEGTTNDAEGLRRQHERWQQDVAPAAEGFLGVTGGVAADGTVILLARFEDEKSASRANAGPEQDAWWNETAKYFDGDPTVRGTTDVELQQGGGSDAAGFVQVISGRVRDRARLVEIETKLMSKMQEMRPDVIGSVRAWDGDRFTEAIYFTSEADARAGEATMGESMGGGGDQVSEDVEGEPLATMAELESLMEDVAYIDLTEPWIAGP
jgi:hypothetical protein